MSFLRNLIYLLLLATVSPWLLYQAWRNGKYRAGWNEKLFGRVPRRHGDRRCIWFHAVSVGEVNLLRPLIARWEQEFPEWDCVISTTTRTGFELAHQRYAPRTVFYAPLDFSWAVDRALRRIRPDLLVMAELEVWPNWIAAATAGGIPVAIINGRLSAKSFQGYQRLRRFLQPTFAQLAAVGVQNDEYAERFRQMGVPAELVQTTGSIKFEDANIDRQNPQTKRLAALAGIEPSDCVFLAGSTQESEEAAALAAYEALRGEYPQLRLLFVPRHPERFDAVAELLTKRGVQFQRRSQLEKQGADNNARVLLVDVVGELGAWWGTAHIAFVGGSLTQRGGQNMIEPAAYGAAVCFGPNTWNFKDVVELLLANNAAAVVRNEAELTAFVRKSLAEPAYAIDLGKRARELVIAQTGAAEKTMRLLARCVPQLTDLAPTLPPSPPKLTTRISFPQRNARAG
jgi:3-deoxy-D-manno-octulosonic-acid transferase